MPDPDIIVIGAGVAGLSAALNLTRAGLHVQVIEARDRIGGRIFTVRDSENYPVELGAEFVHGRPPEIWDLLRDNKIATTEVAGDTWCVRQNQLQPCDFFSDVEDILGKMDARGPDESFLDFLSRCCPNAKPEAKQRALGYVTGFNAADPADVSVHWLALSERAEEKNEGHRAFRIQGGYESLIDVFRGQLAAANVPLHLETIVHEIHWHADHSHIIAHNAEGGVMFASPRVLITVPLGVLHAGPEENGAIRFTPDLPAEKRRALQQIAMGKVIRITLRFRDRFWESIRPAGGDGKSLAGLSFLLSEHEVFPTWWTALPEKLPLMTGWAPFGHAESLSGMGEPYIADKAVEALSEVLGVERGRIEMLAAAAFTHDWQEDPFTRGAYSYVKVGGMDAPRILGAPIGNSLFFAGEATDLSGNTGTVHGAISSANRAVKEIIASK